jgi:hypothetical protein
MKVIVTLTPQELEKAAYGGVQRRIRALQRQRTPNQKERPEWEQKWWQSDIIGAIGEMAVSKAFGVDWHDLEDDVNGKDVLDYQVRTIENPSAGLRVRSHDSTEDIFILTEVRKNKALLHGYSTGAIVRAHAWEEFPRCFTLPKEQLFHVTDLAHPIEWSDYVQAQRPMM